MDGSEEETAKRTHGIIACMLLLVAILYQFGVRRADAGDSRSDFPTGHKPSIGYMGGDGVGDSGGPSPYRQGGSGTQENTR
jgi:hypothetical protein